jgi:hypothetical protein
MNTSTELKHHANITEQVTTLQSLSTALSVTADLPNGQEIKDIVQGGDLSAYHLGRINVTLVRVLSALKVREDAS